MDLIEASAARDNFVEFYITTEVYSSIGCSR